MQSKTSYFKTILTKNITRFWPMWALNAFVWAIFPIALLLSGRGNYDISKGEDYFMGPLEAAVPIYVFIYACVVAMSVWGYLYQAKSVSLMHSLPVTRVQLFMASYVSGVIMILIPLLTAAVILALVEIFFGALAVKAMFAALLLTLLNILIFFSFATLIAHITGHIFGLPALYVIFNFLAVGLGYIISGYIGSLGFGYDADYSGEVNFLSPLVYIVEKVERIYRADEPTRVMPENVHILVIYALVGLAAAALACLIYRDRRSETAGDLVALRFLRPVALYSFTACVALTGGLILASLFGALNGRYEPNVPGLAICMIISAFIGYYVGLMLLNKKLRVFTKKSLRGVLIVSALCVFYIALIKTDAAGREKKVPETADIKGMVITVQGESYNIGGNNREEMLIQATDLHRKIIAAKDEIVNFQGWTEMDQMYNPNSGLTVSGMYFQGYWMHVHFNYTLTNGKTLNRSYSIPVTASIASNPNSIYQDVVALINKPSFQLEYYRYGQEIEFDGGYTYVGRDLTGLDYFDFTADEAEEVYNAVIADIMEGNYISPSGDMDRYLYISYTTPDDIIYYSNGDTSKFYSSFNIYYNDNMAHTRETLKKVAENHKDDNLG